MSHVMSICYALLCHGRHLQAVLWCKLQNSPTDLSFLQTLRIVPPSAVQYLSFKRRASCISSRHVGGRRNVEVGPAGWVLPPLHPELCGVTLQYYQHTASSCYRMTRPRARVLQMNWAWPTWVVSLWYWWGAWAWHVSSLSASLCGSRARWLWKRGWGTYCKTPSGNFTLSHYAALTLLSVENWAEGFSDSFLWQCLCFSHITDTDAANCRPSNVNVAEVLICILLCKCIWKLLSTFSSCSTLAVYELNLFAKHYWHGEQH